MYTEKQKVDHFNRLYKKHAKCFSWHALWGGRARLMRDNTMNLGELRDYAVDHPDGATAKALRDMGETIPESRRGRECVM